MRESSSLLFGAAPSSGDYLQHSVFVCILRCWWLLYAVGWAYGAQLQLSGCAKKAQAGLGGWYELQNQPKKENTFFLRPKQKRICHFNCGVTA